MRIPICLLLTAACAIPVSGAFAQSEEEITLNVTVSGSADELQPLLDALREMEQRPKVEPVVHIEEKPAEVSYQTAATSGEIGGEWKAQGRRPLADGTSALLASPSATVVQDGQNTVVRLDDKTFKGQFVGGVLIATHETGVPATGRSGKGRTKVAQTWTVHLQTMSDGTLLGRYAVRHSGFQAADNHKNSTQFETLRLSRH